MFNSSTSYIVEFLVSGSKETREWSGGDTVATMKEGLAVSHGLAVANITLSYNGKHLNSSTVVASLASLQYMYL